MSRRPTKSSQSTPASYEGTPAKLLPEITKRIRRKEPELDQVTKRLTRTPR